MVFFTNVVHLLCSLFYSFSYCIHHQQSFYEEFHQLIRKVKINGRPNLIRSWRVWMRLTVLPDPLEVLIRQNSNWVHEAHAIAYMPYSEINTGSRFTKNILNALKGSSAYTIRILVRMHTTHYCPKKNQEGMDLWVSDSLNFEPHIQYDNWRKSGIEFWTMIN